ncbi:MAG: ABC transporter permease [Saprospiraceae bacterium]
MKRTLFNFRLAVEGVMDNRLRAVLTALGIVFGVGAVIAMLAIGTGAKQEILDRMKLIGTNNIQITTLLEAESNGEDEEGQKGDKRPFSPGLTLKDAKSIEELIPSVEMTSPEVVLPVSVVYGGLLKKANCVGITNAFFELNNLKLEKGKLFHSIHLEKGYPICIIGNNIQSKFFTKTDPIGQQIKCGDTWLTIVGVIQKRFSNKKSLEDLGIRDFNSDIYIPINTALLRFNNRATINQSALVSNDWDNDEDESDEAKNYHQLDRLVIRVKDSKELIASAGVVSRLLNRRHNEIRDYKIEVPELLLEQEQKTQETFNIVLAVIAGISLLVGGIGIMNIMLASVLERIKEIGVRRSLGATRRDIILQFLFESIFISLLGGLLGVLVGVGAAKTIAAFAEITTIISAWSVILSFGIATSVGLVFGIIPARRASLLDPIKALRND